MIDVGAQHDSAERTHQEARAERRKGKHQGREFAAARKESLRDRRRIVAEDHEVVHLEEVSAGYADHPPDLLFALCRRHEHGQWTGTVSAWPGFLLFMMSTNGARQSTISAR